MKIDGFKVQLAKGKFIGRLNMEQIGQKLPSSPLL